MRDEERDGIVEEWNSVGMEGWRNERLENWIIGGMAVEILSDVNSGQLRGRGTILRPSRAEREEDAVGSNAILSGSRNPESELEMSMA